jgi:hypothetical protein
LLDKQRRCSFITKPVDEPARRLAHQNAEDSMEVKRREVGNCRKLLEGHIFGKVLFDEVDHRVDSLDVEMSTCAGLNPILRPRLGHRSLLQEGGKYQAIG